MTTPHIPIDPNEPKSPLEQWWATNNDSYDLDGYGAVSTLWGDIRDLLAKPDALEQIRKLIEGGK